MPKKLLLPEQVETWLSRRYANQHRAWIEGAGDWPLLVTLGVPTESEASADLSGVRAWVDAWDRWNGAGELVREERRWGRLGTQTLPAAVSLPNASAVAAWCGQTRRWTRARDRFDVVASLWPVLLERPGLSRHFDVLADYSDADFQRLLAVVEWFLANPDSNLYVRQLPIEGVHTKWVESRMSLISNLLILVRGCEPTTDFFEVTGLRRVVHRIRLRVLCPMLRESLGGLRDIEAPLEELATLRLRPDAILVVENLESGVALPDMQGVVALMGLGHSVSLLGSLPWLSGIPAIYWGDIDTHGLVILSKARRVFPDIKAVLMDESTLKRFAEFAVEEPSQHPAGELLELTSAERALFDGLRSGVWGTRLRLEQERLSWPYALETLADALASVARSASGAVPVEPQKI